MTRVPNAFKFFNKRPARPVFGFTVALVAAWICCGITGVHAQSVEDQLETAKRLYQAADLDGARTALDRAIAAIEPKALEDAVLRAQLLKAYELRARARFNLGDLPGTTADLQAVLRYDADYTLGTEASQKLLQLFDEVRHATIAEIVLSVAPTNADVTLDGTSIAERTGRLPIIAGTHKIVVSKAGYKPLERAFNADAGSAQELIIALERSAATVSIVTHPVGVEVVIGGARRGETRSGETNAAMVNAARAWNVPVGDVSAPFIVPDLLVGRYAFEFRRPCFTTETRYVDVTRLDDLELDPVFLKPAVATLRLEATTPATVFVDDVPKGPTPRTLADVCEGPHTIELRSSSGRFVRRVDLHAGEQRTLSGTAKPAFAILSVSGLPEGLRGAGDIRVAVENALADAARITLFAPSPERAQQVLASQRLSTDWLAYDRGGIPQKDAARNITAQGLRDLSNDLARSMEAQGVAAVTLKEGQDRNELLVSLLAQGSSRPDVIQFRIDDPESLRRALTDLDLPTPLYRPSIGLLALDVQTESGATVIVADVDIQGPAAQAGINTGSVIASADGKPVSDAASLERILENADRERKNNRIRVELRGASGASRQLDIPVVWIARAISQHDQTLLFNPVLASLRNELAKGSASDEPVLRLNIAIALMSLGNWVEARSELDRIQMRDGRGVAQGTVNYLLGLCYEALGQFADAAKAWTAAKNSEAGLTEDGPPVKELAAAKLSRMSMGRSGGIIP